MQSKAFRHYAMSLPRLMTVFVLLLTGLGVSGQLAHSAAPFYEGKTIRIIVGTSPGGGYDTYTRLIARHFGKYIPGNPTIIVDNMPGAGGLVSANHLFKIAKPDGLTIGHSSSMHSSLNTSGCLLRITSSLGWPRRRASQA
jgi:tripartite-type tricarboxylate transporter receptor subunit TctC